MALAITDKDIQNFSVLFISIEYEVGMSLEEREREKQNEKVK